MSDDKAKASVQGLQTFKRLKNFAYQISFHLLQDQEVAEQAVIDSMTRLLHYENLLPKSWEGRSYFVGLLTAHISLVELRKHRGQMDRKAYEELFTDSSDFYQTGNRLYDLDKAVDTLNLQDKIILSFIVCFNFTSEELGDLLKLRPSAIRRRVNRSLSVLNRRVPRQDRRPYQPADPAIQQTIFLKLKDQTNRMEAISNLNKHEFSSDFDRKALHSIASGKSGSFFESLIDLFSNKKTSLYAFALTIFLIVAIVAFFHSENPTKPKAVITDEKELASEEEHQSDEILYTKKLPASHYALYETAVYIVDPDTFMLYEILQDGNARELLSLENQVKENGAIVHLGKVGEVIYIAFANGKGGTLEGQPLEFELTSYWQSAWFKGQKEVKPGEETEFIAGGTAYKLSPAEE